MILYYIIIKIYLIKKNGTLINGTQVKFHHAKPVTHPNGVKLLHSTVGSFAMEEEEGTEGTPITNRLARRY